MPPGAGTGDAGAASGSRLCGKGSAKAQASVILAVKNGTPGGNLREDWTADPQSASWPLDVGQGEIVALEQERRIEFPRERVHKAVAVVQDGRLAAALAVALESF